MKALFKIRNSRQEMVLKYVLSLIESSKPSLVVKHVYSNHKLKKKKNGSKTPLDNCQVL